MARNKSGRAYALCINDALPFRFWEKVIVSATCWQWIGGMGRGYGTFHWRGRSTSAHRLCYETLVGPIPEDRELDHICRNRGCVNPEHLRVVDHRTNVLAGMAQSAINAAKVCCQKGHPFIVEGKQRRCAVCKREREQQRARAARIAKWDRIWSMAGV